VYVADYPISVPIESSIITRK